MARNTRTKSVPACASCRKSKVRCEVLDDLTQKSLQTVRCHRCKTLQIQCSYESMDKLIFLTGPITKTHEFEQVIRLGVDVPDDSVVSGAGPAPIATEPATEPAPVSRSSSVVAWTKAGESVVDMESLPRHIWQFHRGSSGVWYYHGLFHYEDSLDWAQPLGAIQQLSSRYNATVVTRPRIMAAATTASPSGIDALEEILSKEQKQNLLQIFEEKYTPWLNFSLLRSDANPNSTLDLICCTIASRNLRANDRSVVAPKLEAATEDAVSRLLLHPVPSESLEAIQCLLILALWAPICGGSGNNRRDGHLLLASAISMAKNIRLNEAPDRLQALRDLQNLGHTFDEAQIADTASRARLWLTLTNTDSLLCVGTGRNTYSNRNSSHRRLYPFPVLSSSSIPPSLNEARDTRLKLLGEILDATEAGLKVWLDSLDGVKKWYEEVTESLQRLDHVERLITPLPVVSDHDNFHFRMLIFIYRVCRLLVTYHAFYNSRMLFLFFGSTPDPKFFEGKIPHSLDILAIWCKDGFHNAENNLVSLLEVDVSLLSTSPDIIFQMISLISIYLVSFKFFVFHSNLKAMPGVHDYIIAKCVGVLNAAAYSEDHAASRCATLIQGAQALWDNRDEILATGEHVIDLQHKAEFYSNQSTMTGNVYETMGANLQMLYGGGS